MAIINGTAGAVEIAAGAVAEVKDFTLNRSAAALDASVHGSANKAFIAGAEEWSGSINVLLDPDDANQDSIDKGDTLALELYPNGNTSGEPSYTGSAIVTSIEMATPYGEISTLAISFQGTGALTKGTVV